MAAKSLLLALFTLLFGVAIGYVIAPADADPTQVVPVDHRSGIVAAAESKRPAELKADVVDASRSEAATDVPIPARTLAPERVDRAIADVHAPSIDPESGEGKIWGEVRTKDGEPLADVTLILTRNQPWSGPAQYPAVGRAAPEVETLDSALRTSADHWAMRRATRSRVRTDAEGAYEFLGLVEGGEYSIEGYLEGLSIETKSSSVQVGERCDLVGARISALTIEVVDVDGEVVPEARISLKAESNHSGLSHDWKATDPPLGLLAGIYEVIAFGEVQFTSGRSNSEDANLKSETVTVRVPENGSETVRLILKPVVGVRGRVIGGDKEWIEVKLIDLASADQFDEEALASSSTDTYARGRKFHFHDLAPGTYAVGIAQGRKRVSVHQVVEVTDGMAVADLVVPEADPNMQLRLTVLDPDGASLPGVEIGVTRRSGNGSTSHGSRSVPSENGVYVMDATSGLEEFFDPWPPKTTYSLTLEHSSYGTVSVEVEEGTRELTHQYQLPATLIAEVAGYATSDMRGKLVVNAVMKTEDTWRGRGRNEHPVGADGRAEIVGLVPGKYTVSLGVKTDEWRTTTVSTQSVVLAVGETVVRFPIPVLHKVRVLAGDLEPGTNMWMNRKTDESGMLFGGNSQNVEVDADGVAVFENLSAGTYELRANGSMGRMTIDVPCGDVVFEVREPDCLIVQVNDTEGTLALSGFQTGDKVIGIDGQEFDSMGALTGAFYGGGNKEIKAMVLRGSTTLDLTLKVPSGGNFRDLGGHFEPGNRD